MLNAIVKVNCSKHISNIIQRWKGFLTAQSQKIQLQWHVIFDGSCRAGLCYESLIIHQFSIPHCRLCTGFKLRKGNLKSQIDTSRPAKNPSGPARGLGAAPQGARPNLFKSKVRKKLIILNEELRIHVLKRRSEMQSRELQTLRLAYRVVI